MGMTNAAVFPEPVLAMPTTSLLSRAKGIALRWIGVGTEKPFLVMARRRFAFRPKERRNNQLCRSWINCSNLNSKHTHCLETSALLHRFALQVGGLAIGASQLGGNEGGIAIIFGTAGATRIKNVAKVEIEVIGRALWVFLVLLVVLAVGDIEPIETSVCVVPEQVASNVDLEVGLRG